MKFEAEGQEFAKILRSLEQSVRNSERSEQFLVTECFFNSFLEVSQIYYIRTIEIKIVKKMLGFRNLQEKLEKVILSVPIYFLCLHFDTLYLFPFVLIRK